MLWRFSLILLGLLGSTICSDQDESFFNHLLRNVKNDILNLKPGSNKTYILNSKLLGRNDSIELDIKSRTKGIHNDKEASRNIMEETNDGPIESKKAHQDSLRDRKERKELRNRIRKAMMKEIHDIQEKHEMKIRKIMKFKENHGKRKKIRIKVLREEKDPGTDNVANKTAGKPLMKHVKKIKILHVPMMRRKKLLHRRKAAAHAQGGADTSGAYVDEDDSAFEEGGQIQQLFLGNEYDVEELSAMFRNTKDLVTFVISTTPTSTTTTTTTTEPTTKILKNEYTYEYVYEDELEKGKEKAKKDKHDAGNKKETGATSDEYTYEYIYEDEMKKGNTFITNAPVTKPPTTQKSTRKIITTTRQVPEETPELVEDDSDQEPTPMDAQVLHPCKLSPSIEEEIKNMEMIEMNSTKATFDPEEYVGDSNSQYKEPKRFQYEEVLNPDEMSDYQTEYDWNAPFKPTQPVTYRIAASSIMYDDEDTQEFLAERNRTKLARGYDSYPADHIFTCDIRKLSHRYTRPQLTPEDYESYDNDLDHWGNAWEDMLPMEKSHNRTTRKPWMNTKKFNATKRRNYNMTVNNRREYRQFNLEEYLKNSTNFWMRNMTEKTTRMHTEDEDVYATMDLLYPFHIPERKIRRQKRDIGNGMKMPRRQYEALMYLFQKVNHTRWIARLKKMRYAPNLMEMLIKRDKKKVNKNSIVYKQKAMKPKKRPKGPKRVVLKKRKPKPNHRALRIKLAASRRRKKQSQQRRKRSVDELLDNLNQGYNHIKENYIDIKALDETIDNYRQKRYLENIDLKHSIRNKRETEKLSDDFLHDFENNPEQMQEYNNEDYAAVMGNLPPSSNEDKSVKYDESCGNYANDTQGTTVRMTPKQRTDPKLWMTEELLKEIHIRDTLFFESKYHNKSAIFRHKYIKQRNKVNRMLVKAKNDYTRRLYYMGTDQFNETLVVRSLQNQRLTDEMNNLLKNLKCPHCHRLFRDQENTTSTYKMKFTKRRFTFVVKTVSRKRGKFARIQSINIRSDFEKPSTFRPLTSSIPI